MIWAAVAALATVACAKEPQALAADGVSASKIERKLLRGGSAAMEGKHIEGDLDFTRAGEGLRATAMARVHVGGEVAFENCVFEGDVSARADAPDGRGTTVVVFDKDVSFVGCVFEGCVDLSLCSFKGTVRMENCVIRGTARFEGSRALDGIILNRTVFEGDASLDGIRMGPGTSLIGVKFSQAALMPNIWAEDDLMIGDCEFGGITDLSHLHASGGLNLSNCRFAKRTECRDSDISGGVTVSNTEFGGNVTCENVTVGGRVTVNAATFGRNIEVTRCVFLQWPEISGLRTSDASAVKVEENGTTSSPIKAEK